MAKGKKLTKQKNIKTWKQGINNVKNINMPSYTRNMRGGIRLT